MVWLLDGWVYTNDAWVGPRAAPYTASGGSVTSTGAGYGGCGAMRNGQRRIAEAVYCLLEMYDYRRSSACNVCASVRSLKILRLILVLASHLLTFRFAKGLTYIASPLKRYQ